MIKKEWKHLFHNKFLLLAVIAIITIPTIYTTLFLGSMWDPYGSLEHLPVAIVNNDIPVSYNDKTLSIGEDMVDSLKEDTSLHYDFVDEQTADYGLKNGDYYMVITIPSDFSNNASTVLDDTPRKMELQYKTNPGTNYIASKLSETAFEKIKTKVASNVTKVYTETIFEQIDTIGGKISEAADGSTKLKDGIVKIKDGNQTIEENLETLANSTLTFKDGSDTLLIGLKEYTSGVSKVNDGLETLQTGMNTLVSGADSLVDGTNKLADGSHTFTTSLSAYTDGVSSASSGAKQLVSGIEAYTSGVSNLQAGSKTLTTYNTLLNNGMEQLTNGLKTLTKQNDTLQTSISTISQGVDGITSGLTKLNQMVSSNTPDTNATSLAQIQKNNEQIVTLLNEITTLDQSQKDQIINLLTENNNYVQNTQTEYAKTLSAVKTISTTITPVAEKLQQGLHGTNTSTGLIDGITAYTNGVMAISDSVSSEKGLAPSIQSYTENVSTLSNGLTTLNDSNQTLLSGSKQLSDGLQTLTDSTTPLLNGALQLDDGIHQLKEKSPTLIAGISALNDGTNTLKSGTEALVSNNNSLLDGMNQLTNGASMISDGAFSLTDGANTLQNGITSLEDGASTLSSSLQKGADDITSTNTTDTTIDMIDTPITESKTQLTNISNNGHGMAPYMMSVALWVACIAFSIMYPITRYEGEVTSGFSWWISKATVLFIISISSALLMIASLHTFIGFQPVEMTKTVLLACLASMAFMSLMYFFNAWLGKIGSFLMLVYMVIQLSGSAGTYPVEISGSFVSSIHAYLPFTYTVNGFRATISGNGTIHTPILILLFIIVLFSILTILLFHFRSKRIKEQKETFMDFLEEKGFA